MTLEKRLERAVSELLIAHTLVYGSASGVEPFIRSKFLNILGKEIEQLSLELRVFLGHIEIPNIVDGRGFEFNFPSLELLKKIQEDDPVS